MLFSPFEKKKIVHKCAHIGHIVKIEFFGVVWRTRGERDAYQLFITQTELRCKQINGVALERVQLLSRSVVNGRVHAFQNRSY